MSLLYQVVIRMLPMSSRGKPGMRKYTYSANQKREALLRIVYAQQLNKLNSV